MNPSIVSHRIKYIAIGLLVFIGMSALGGGLMLIMDPTGNSMEFTLDLLSSTPFNDYSIPGILLFSFIGLMSLTVAWIVKNQWNYAYNLLIIQGLIIIIWLTVQLILNNDFYLGLYHIPLYFMGTIICIIGVALKKSSTTK